MLIQPDKRMLGDVHLSPTENVHRQREDLLKMASKHRIGGQEGLEDPERACGPRLQYSEVISRLKCVSPRLIPRDGSPGNIALYFPRNSEELEEAREEWDNDRDEFFLYHKYVGGFPKHEIQEFSTIDIDSSHLPTREHRSWRTVLITLLKQGVLSYNQAVRQFGDVGTDRRGWRWKEQTKPWKDNPNNIFAQRQADTLAG